MLYYKLAEALSEFVPSITAHEKQAPFRLLLNSLTTNANHAHCVYDIEKRNGTLYLAALQLYKGHPHHAEVESIITAYFLRNLKPNMCAEEAFQSKVFLVNQSTWLNGDIVKGIVNGNPNIIYTMYDIFNCIMRNHRFKSSVSQGASTGTLSPIEAFMVKFQVEVLRSKAKDCLGLINLNKNVLLCEDTQIKELKEQVEAIFEDDAGTEKKKPAKGSEPFRFTEEVNAETHMLALACLENLVKQVNLKDFKAKDLLTFVNNLIALAITVSTAESMDDLREAGINFLLHLYTQFRCVNYSGEVMQSTKMIDSTVLTLYNAQIDSVIKNTLKNYEKTKPSLLISVFKLFSKFFRVVLKEDVPSVRKLIALLSKALYIPMRSTCSHDFLTSL